MLRIYLRRSVSIVALALVALAISQPVSANNALSDLEPVTEAVADAVETTTGEVVAAVESEAEIEAPAPKKVVETTVDETTVPGTEVAPQATNPSEASGNASAAVPSRSGASTASTSSPDEASATTRPGGASRANASQEPAARGGRAEADDTDELLAAGNDVVTTLVLGTRIERNTTEITQPKKSSGAPLALTGTSILMGLLVALVLMALGVGTETAARRTGTVAA